MTPERARNGAVAVPMVCAVLLAPPAILLFTGQATVFGIPVVVAFVFSVWLAAILATALFARRLRMDDET